MRRLIARPSSWRTQGFEVRNLEAGGGSAVLCIDGSGSIDVGEECAIESMTRITACLKHGLPAGRDGWTSVLAEEIGAVQQELLDNGGCDHEVSVAVVSMSDECHVDALCVGGIGVVRNNAGSVTPAIAPAIYAESPVGCSVALAYQEEAWAYPTVRGWFAGVEPPESHYAAWSMNESDSVLVSGSSAWRELRLGLASGCGATKAGRTSLRESMVRYGAVWIDVVAE